LEKIAGRMLDTDPGAGRDMLFGAWALNDLEARFTNHVLSHWHSGRSSLR
jgi:hypothetical protein